MPKPHKRNLRKKSCIGKRKYGDHETAKRAAAIYERQFHAWMTAYKCRFCGCWHIGHPPKNVRRSIIQKFQNTHPTLEDR